MSTTTQTKPCEARGLHPRLSARAKATTPTIPLRSEDIGAIEAAIHAMLLGYGFGEQGQVESRLGIDLAPNHVAMADLGETLFACGAVLRCLQEQRSIPVDQETIDLLRKVEVDTASGLSTEPSIDNEDDVCSKARLLRVELVREMVERNLQRGDGSDSRAVSPIGEVPIGTVAATIEIDLSPPYRRAIVAHILGHRLAHVIEGERFFGIELPEVDAMAHRDVAEVVGPVVERVQDVVLLRGLLVSLMDGARDLSWPFDRALLLTGVQDCVSRLHESLDETPDDALERHAEATLAARNWLAELSGGDSQ